MVDKRKIELKNFATKALDELVEVWWFEIGSWDEYLVNADITMKELEWIWDNIHPRTFVQMDLREVVNDS